MNERQSNILEFIEKKQRVSVKRISEQFFVSEMTVRRDLKEMEKCGYIKRYRGGAIFDSGSILPINVRKFAHFDGREEIMNSASKYLRSNISIFLDSSSTCMYIIPAAAEFEGITLITNSIQNLLFAEKYHIKCIIAGGDYYERDMCTTGSHTENFLRGINTDVSFFSAQGLSDDGIISDNDENQSAIRKIVMKNSKKNIFFFDESKLGAKYLYTVCCADETDEIIILKAH